MTPQEMQDLSKEFARQLKIVFGNNGPGNSNSNQNNSNRRSSSNSIRDSEGESNYRKNFKRDLIGFSKSLRTIVDDADKVMRDFTISQRGMVNLQNKIYSDIVNNEKLTNKAQERLRKRLNEWARQQSNLSGQLLDAAGNYKDINKYLEETADKLEDYNDVLDENMSTTVRGITSLKKMAKAIDKLGKSTQYTAAMQAIMAKDVHGNFINSLSEQKKQRKELIEQLANSIDQENEARKKSRLAILGQAADMGRTAGYMAELNSIGEKALQAGGFGFLLTKGTILLAAFVNALAQIPEYYNRIKASLSLGQTGLADPIKLTVQASRIGISFEKLTALLNENYRTMASLGGPEAFVDTIVQYRGALNAMGEFGEAADKGVAGMLEGARASGIDLRNKIALNESMAKQQDAYTYLRAAINETGETFAKNNLSVLQSAEYEARSVLLSKKRRSQLISEIAQGRKELAKSGILNSEIQMSILKQTQALLNKPVVDRFKTVGDITKAGGQLGMNDEADMIRKILLKGNAASPKEQKTLYDLLTKMAKKNNANLLAAQQRGDYGAENIANIIGADIIKAMPDMNKTIIEGANPNNKKDLGAEADKRKVSEREQYIINNVERIARLLGDRIVKAIIALGLVVAGLMIFKSLTGVGVGIMGFIGGLFLAVKTGVLRGIAFIFGTGTTGGIVGFIVKTIAKYFAPAVILAGVVRGFTDLMDDQRYKNGDFTERLTNAVSGILAGIISTGISAITFGTINIGTKDIKNGIENYILPILGGILSFILTPIGGLFFAIGKLIIYAVRELWNVIMDGIDSEWMPNSVRKKIQSFKYEGDTSKVDYGDGSGNNDWKEYGKNILKQMFGIIEDTSDALVTNSKNPDNQTTDKTKTDPAKKTTDAATDKTKPGATDKTKTDTTGIKNPAKTDVPTVPATVTKPASVVPKTTDVAPIIKQDQTANITPDVDPVVKPVAQPVANVTSPPIQEPPVPIKPKPTMIAKNTITSPLQLQEKALDDTRNEITNKQDTTEKHIDSLNAILEILKAQYALELQVSLKNRGLFADNNIFDTSPSIG